MAADEEAPYELGDENDEEINDEAELLEKFENDFDEKNSKVEGGFEVESQETEPEPLVKISEDHKSTLFFSNLPNEVRTPQYLKYILNAIGKGGTQACFVVGDMGKNKKIQRSAFVAFETEAKARKVVEILNSTGVREAFEDCIKKREYVEVGPKTLNVMRKSKKFQDQQFIPRNSLHYENKWVPNECIYIPNMSRTATDEEIRTTFGSFGSIKDLTFLKLKKGITHRGKCFITYGSIMEATNAVEQMDLQEFQGKPLIVKFFDNRQRSDCSDGQTLILENVPSTINESVIYQAFSHFGEIGYIIKCIDPYTEKPTGCVHVRFRNKKDVEVCLKQSEITNGIEVAGNNVTVSIDTPETWETSEVDEKDVRNLHLAKEGQIRPLTEAALGVSASDMGKRLVLEAWKRSVLKNKDMCVSDKRLCVRNIPTVIKDKAFNKIIKEAAGPDAVITECTIMREETKNIEDSNPKVFALVSFSEHEHALAALRTLNNNRNHFMHYQYNQRPIVEFALESRVVKKDEWKINENDTEGSPNKEKTVGGSSTEVPEKKNKNKKKKRKNKDDDEPDAPYPPLKQAKIQVRPQKKQFETWRGRGYGDYRGNLAGRGWQGYEEKQFQANRLLSQLSSVIGAAADMFGSASPRPLRYGGQSERFVDCNPPPLRWGNYDKF